MKTICVTLPHTATTAITLHSITNTFPCFISLVDQGEYVECAITARQEDTPSVERALAALV